MKGLLLVWIKFSETSLRDRFIFQQQQNTEPHAGFQWLEWGRGATLTDENKMGEENGEEMKCENYTCETQHGAHTPLMQTAVLQEKHWSLKMFALWLEYS